MAKLETKPAEEWAPYVPENFESDKSKVTKAVKEAFESGRRSAETKKGMFVYLMGGRDGNEDGTTIKDYRRFIKFWVWVWTIILALVLTFALVLGAIKGSIFIFNKVFPGNPDAVKVISRGEILYNQERAKDVNGPGWPEWNDLDETNTNVWTNKANALANEEMKRIQQKAKDAKLEENK